MSHDGKYIRSPVRRNQLSQLSQAASPRRPDAAQRDGQASCHFVVRYALVLVPEEQQEQVAAAGVEVLDAAADEVKLLERFKRRLSERRVVRKRVFESRVVAVVVSGHRDHAGHPSTFAQRLALRGRDEPGLQISRLTDLRQVLDKTREYDLKNVSSGVLAAAGAAGDGVHKTLIPLYEGCPRLRITGAAAEHKRLGVKETGNWHERVMLRLPLL